MNIALPEKISQMQEVTPWAPHVSSFGSTESASHVTLALPDDPLDERVETLGRPLPGIEIKIVDPETGHEQPAGVVGELCWTGYNRFEGYFKDPEATAKAIDADDWFHTGDLGLVDERGCFVYSGRLKDMLKVGGENVSSARGRGLPGAASEREHGAGRRCARRPL